MAGVSCLAFFFDVSAAFESIGTDRVPIFDRPVSGRETLSQLVFVLALHFVQHLPPSLFLCWRLAFYGFQSFQIQLEAHGAHDCPRLRTFVYVLG